MPKARTYDEEMKFIEQVDKHRFRIKKGFVPNMQVGHVHVLFDTASSF